MKAAALVVLNQYIGNTALLSVKRSVGGRLAGLRITSHIGGSVCSEIHPETSVYILESAYEFLDSTLDRPTILPTEAQTDEPSRIGCRIN